MGMIGHVQFMNLCSQGDMGIPPETAALSDGMGWANLQFDPPWGSSSGNSSGNKTNSTASSQRRAMGPLRRLLEDPAKDAEKALEPPLPWLQRKSGAKKTLEGTLFSGLACMIAEGIAHYILLLVISFGTNMPTDVLPTSVQWPGWEMASFLQLWNPLALSSTMAFSRYAVDYAHDGEHYLVVLASLCVCLFVQLPWFVFQIW